MAEQLSYPPEEGRQPYRLGSEIGSSNYAAPDLYTPLENEYHEARVKRSGFDQFMGELSEYRLLEHEEEAHFSKQYQAGIAAGEIIDSYDLPPGDKEALEQIKEAGDYAREVMVKANLRLVVHTALKNRYMGGVDNDIEALMANGELGLLRAVEKFDPNKGYKFSTYAAWWIRQSIQRGLGENRTIRVPVHINEGLSRIDRAERRLEAMGYPVNTENIAAETRLSEDKVAEYQEVRNQRISSIDADLKNHDGIALADYLPDKETERQFEAVEMRYDMAHIEEIAQEVITDKRGWKILCMRSGIDGEPVSLEVVGREFGLTRERVRQLETRSKMQLREALEARHIYKTDFGL